MSTEPVVKGKDYLSALPDELLLAIFDPELHQYWDPVARKSQHALPYGPPSRRFLPFYLKAKYRSLNFDTLASVQTAIGVLRRSPENGQLVQDLSCLQLIPNASLQTLFDLTPNLLELYLAPPRPVVAGGLVAIFSSALLTRFTTLRSLTLPASSIAQSSREQYLDLDFLNWLTRYSNLETLRLIDWRATDLKVEGSQNQVKIRNLRLDDDDGLHPNAVPTVDLLSLCPRLETLMFETEITPSVSLRRVFENVKSPLQRLYIDVGEVHEPIDPLLTRLSSLRSLTLTSPISNGIYSQDLSRNLSHLQFLTHLSLSCDTPNGAIEHVRRLLDDGPYRLPSLKNLKLDHKWQGNPVFAGRRFAPTIDCQIGWSEEWTRSWCDIPGEEYSPTLYQEAKAVIEIAASTGVELEGELFTGVRSLDQLLLEAHNLAVGEAFFEEDLGNSEGNRYRAKDYGFVEPVTEIADEEREDWVLVKTEVIFAEEASVEEERWFSLSLVNKKDGSVMGERKGL